MTFHRILIATDLTNASADAACTGRALSAENAEARVLHVVSHALPRAFHPERDLRELEDVLSAARASAEAQAMQQAESLAFTRVDARVLAGSVAATVAAEAREWDADLVTVGGRSHGLMDRLLFGARGRAILRHAPVSVLVGRGRVDAIRHVVVATDFGASSERAAAVAQRIVTDAQGAADADVTLLHCVDPSMWGDILLAPPEGPQGGRVPSTTAERVNRSADEMLATFNDEATGGTARTKRIEGPPMKRIGQFLRDVDADLLVVGTHGPGPVERTLLGSVAEGLAAEAPCPVLVVKE